MKNKIIFYAYYYEYSKGRYYKKVGGKEIIFSGLEDFQFAFLKEDNEYVVRETKSGQIICKAKTLAGINAAIEAKIIEQGGLEKVKAIIRYCIKMKENEKIQ